MKTVILSGFVVLLIIIRVQGRDPNRCGVFMKKCENDQYCWRVFEKNPPVEYCVPFRREGELCDDAGKVCYPGLFCQVESVGFLKVCK
ncbi:hypothetical protein TNIN_407711 [Trichonephila inaurata madagascariensis]|uniref:Uncharacterized protein n=1 Tax=Trichonephila inaurata madagascariensis TaxID=2747483 RepID=A0A8X6IE20_9ARAC|nr:hypothetical protein TNIN_407711 [Trichonephila inaurata madagascariensis]